MTLPKSAFVYETTHDPTTILQVTLVHAAIQYHPKSTYFGNTFGAPPVSSWDICEGWDEAVSVKSIITAIAQQHVLLSVPLTTNIAHVGIDLTKTPVTQTTHQVSHNCSHKPHIHVVYMKKSTAQHISAQTKKLTISFNLTSYVHKTSENLTCSNWCILLHIPDTNKVR